MLTKPMNTMIPASDITIQLAPVERMRSSKPASPAAGGSALTSDAGGSPVSIAETVAEGCGVSVGKGVGEGGSGVRVGVGVLVFGGGVAVGVCVG